MPGRPHWRVIISTVHSEFCVRPPTSPKRSENVSPKICSALVQIKEVDGNGIKICPRISARSLALPKSTGAHSSVRDVVIGEINALLQLKPLAVGVQLESELAVWAASSCCCSPKTSRYYSSNIRVNTLIVYASVRLITFNRKGPSENTV